MNAIDLTITTCIHLVSYIPGDYTKPKLGSGIIIEYKRTLFLITAYHFVSDIERKIGIVTGFVENNLTLTQEIGGFSNLEKHQFEDYDLEDLEYVISGKGRGEFLDFAVAKINLGSNIKQNRYQYSIDQIGDREIEEGFKGYIKIEDNIMIDDSEVCSFFGRIKPHFIGKILHFTEFLYSGLSIKHIGEYEFEMDLGEPIGDKERFEGISGAPIYGSNMNLFGILVGSPPGVKTSTLYGIRMDKILQFIELTYFQENISSA